VQFKVFAWIAALRQKWQAAKKTVIKQKSVSEAAVNVSVHYLLILLKKNIGLRFCMLDIQLVFLRIFGVGLNTQDSECMRNYWQMLFAAFFAFFVAGFLPRFYCASKSSSLPK